MAAVEVACPWWHVLRTKLSSAGAYEYNSDRTVRGMARESRWMQIAAFLSVIVLTAATMSHGQQCPQFDVQNPPVAPTARPRPDSARAARPTELLRKDFMIRFSIAWMAAILLALPAFAADAKRPVPLIFDTDIGNDVDDVLALGLIHALESRGECQLLAVTVSKDHELSAPFADAINTFYGRGDIPIGVVRGGVTPEASRYTSLATVRDDDRLRYPHDLFNAADAPDAVTVLRRVLSAAEEESVVIVQAGFSTNLARLLSSPPDAVDGLNGVDLVRKTVRLLSVMGGGFATSSDKPQAEYNIKTDIPSATELTTRWPTPIVFSGLEIGEALRYPAESIEQDFAYLAHHPLVEVYRLYEPMPYNRPTWDLTSVLYAVRPDRGYFSLSPPGTVHIAADGTTSFSLEPTGAHRYLTLSAEQAMRTREALVELVSQPPGLGEQ